MALSERVRSLMRPSVAELSPYDPGFTPAEVLLSANENSFGLPEGVRAGVVEALAGVALNRYPDPMSNELRDAIAAWHGTSRQNVCVGNGGDELIFNLFLAFGGPGAKIVDCPPTFSVYRIYAQMVDTTVVDVPRDAQTFELDVDGVCREATDARVTIVTSPNNPTGNVASHDDVCRICEAAGGLVLLDEAYAEFTQEGASCEDLLAEYDNLVILHTLSKAFASAGARIGYVLAAPDVVDALGAVRQPYSVNVLSQAEAQVCVARRADFVPVIQQIAGERERLAKGIARACGDAVTVWPSQANYLLVRVPDGHGTWQRLRDEHSILVRDFSSTPGLADCLRITVGTSDENDRVVQALATLVRRDAS